MPAPFAADTSRIRHYLIATETARGRPFDSNEPVGRWLLRRDRLHQLELESSSLITDLAPRLAALFPEAKFIFPMRDPFTWLDSVFNQWLALQRGPGNLFWRKWARIRYGAPRQRPGEELLFEMGLATLDSYLTRYVHAFELVRERIPAERLFRIRTQEISARAADIGKFLDPEEPVVHDPASTHAFRTRHKAGVLARLGCRSRRCPCRRALRRRARRVFSGNPFRRGRAALDASRWRTALPDHEKGPGIAPPGPPHTCRRLPTCVKFTYKYSWERFNSRNRVTLFKALIPKALSLPACNVLPPVVTSCSRNVLRRTES